MDAQMDPTPPPATSTELDRDLALLQAVYPPHLFGPRPPDSPTNYRDPNPKPFITLTYAQSLDGKIAGPRGAQIRLSGEESMRLTHRLRELHDSIMVGIGTVQNDDPQLTARLPDLLPIDSQPSPIILDSRLFTPPDCKLITNAQQSISKPPRFVYSRRRSEEIGRGMQFYERKRALEDAGADILEVDLDYTGKKLDLKKLLTGYNSPSFGRSIMVEGGASVITSFLASGLVDLVIITVAPVLVGTDGISMIKPGSDLPHLEHLRTEVYGKDTVFVCRPVYEE